MIFETTSFASKSYERHFFEYWESLGFFENIEMILPREFYLLFEIARLIFSPETESEACNAIEEISKKAMEKGYDRDKSILVNRMEKPVPISNTMDIDKYRTIYDLKKALPRELVWEKEIFDSKLFTRSLQVQRFYEHESDQFKPVFTDANSNGNAAHKFEQKFYLLLDRSTSMEKFMRSFYSKCIVAEFLKKKHNSNAKIFYRPFDSETGPLFITKQKSDFPALIERVLFTTTGGTGTNMQRAIMQALSDINFDKELLDSEILVVTDGVIDDLNKDQLKTFLKDTRLNILKIGRDLAEPNYYEMKKVLSRKGFDFDPQSISLNDIQKKKINSDKDEKLTPLEDRIYQYILDCSNALTDQLREVANKFIEIDDIDKNNLFIMDENTISAVKNSADELKNIPVNSRSIEERTIVYKKAYFLCQYVEFLRDCSKENHSALEKLLEEINLVKQNLLNDPHLFDIVSRRAEFHDDKKRMKLARKEARKKLKEMSLQSKVPSNIDIEKAQLLLTLQPGGEGNAWLLIRAIFIKMIGALKGIFKKGDR